MSLESIICYYGLRWVDSQITYHTLLMVCPLRAMIITKIIMRLKVHMYVFWLDLLCGPHNHFLCSCQASPVWHCLWPTKLVFLLDSFDKWGMFFHLTDKTKVQVKFYNFTSKIVKNKRNMKHSCAYISWIKRELQYTKGIFYRYSVQAGIFIALGNGWKAEFYEVDTVSFMLMLSYSVYILEHHFFLN